MEMSVGKNSRRPVNAVVALISRLHYENARYRKDVVVVSIMLLHF